MKQERIFYQDYLFREVPVDEWDNPRVLIEFSSAIIENAIELSFDSLLRMDKSDNWKSLLKSINNQDVVIRDDVKLINSEVEPYKQFYLKVYYYVISNACRRCAVYSN